MSKISLIESIKVQDQFEVCDPAQSASHMKSWLTPLGRVNAFVGPNNSGKSRLLRECFKSIRIGGFIGHCDEVYKARSLLAKLHNMKLSDNSNRQSRDLWAQSIDNIRRQLTVSALVPQMSGHQKHILAHNVDIYDRAADYAHQRLGLPNYVVTESQVDSIARELDDQLHLLSRGSPFSGRYRRVYVPSRRSLRTIACSEECCTSNGTSQRAKGDILLNGLFADYEFKNDEITKRAEFLSFGTEISTGQSFYADLQTRLLGTRKERQWVAQYQDYLSKHFFQNERVTLIPALGKSLHIKIGSEADRDIKDLGDGIQQLIILTAPYMLNPEDHVVMFVEEPELYLHPGFQRALINAWLEYDNFVQVFVATHSQEFLDITLDRNSITIFRCTKTLAGSDPEEQDARVTVTPVSTDDRRLLQELGIRNSSLMLSNCTIWVEGITDRMYLRRYLELYMEHMANPSTATPAKRFLEDVHYSFVEYGGANITHWSFLEDGEGEKTINVERLCGELLLVMDLDDTKSEAKRERREKLSKVLGDDRFCPLQSREIENILPPKAVLHAVKSRIKKETTLNESIAWENYRSAPLGNFIRDTVMKGVDSPKFAADSGTINDKVRFATDAIAALSSWDDLTDEAKTLTEKIYTFIKSKNT